MTDKRKVIFKPQSYQTITYESEPNLQDTILDEDNQKNPVDDFKNSLSSVWTFNTEFFNYPPISFAEGGSITWGQIIKENILQPFLPKHRIILRHIIKSIKNEQQKKLGNTDDRRPLKLGKGKSSLLIGDATNVNIDHLEKILNEIEQKMDKKNPPPYKPPKAKIYYTRSMKRVASYLKKKKLLDEEETKCELLNHQHYDLNLSLREEKTNLDYFRIYEIEPEEGGPRERIKPKKSVEFNPPKGSHSRINSARTEKPKVSFSASEVKEESNLKKTTRRKSCCCSDCGGLSLLKKQKANIVVPKEEASEPTSLNIDKRFLLAESVPITRGERSVRGTRTSKENGLGFSKVVRDKEYLDVGSRNTLEPLTPSSERRKSINIDPNSLVKTPRTQQSQRSKGSVFSTLVVPGRNPELVHNHSQFAEKPLQNAHHFTILIPPHDHHHHADATLEDQVHQELTAKPTESVVVVHKLKAEPDSKEGLDSQKTISSPIYKTSQVVGRKKKTKSIDLSKKNQVLPRTNDTTRVSAPSTDRPVLIRELARPVSTNHRHNLRITTCASYTKFDDFSKDTGMTPITTASTKREIDTVNHIRNFTLPLSSLFSPQTKAYVELASSPRARVPKKVVNKENNIKKIYTNKVLPIVSNALQLKPISSSLLSRLKPLQKSPGASLPGSKISLDLAPYKSPSMGNIRPTHKPKAMSMSIHPATARTSTCPS